MKLKIVSPHKNNLIYVAIMFTIISLLTNNLTYIILLIPYSFYLYYAKKYYLIYILIFSLIFVFSYKIQETNKLPIQDKYQVVVINNIDQSDYTSFVGKINNRTVIVYLKGNIDVIPGDILNIVGEINVPDSKTTTYGFDYKNYLKSKKIYNTIFADEFSIIDHKFVISFIQFKIEEYIDNNIFYSKEYVKTFILANKNDFDQSTLEQINNLGISHLFAVSGMHIGLIVLFIKKILKQLKISNKKSDIIISLFLILYIIITAFAPSVLRASLMFIFLSVNKHYNIKFNTLDILSLIYILLLIINPFYIYSLGFVLSFFVTFIIILSKNILDNKTKFNQLISLTIIAFSFTLPIIMRINHEVNFLSIVYNIFFIYIITFLILPLSYLTFVFPIFDNIFSLVIEIFEYTITKLYDIDLLKFYINFQSNIILIIYYLLLVLIMISIEKKQGIKQLLVMVLILFLVSSNIQYFNPVSSVNFIDVYGDSTLIVDSFNKCNILIDTGEVDDYDVVVNYLKNKGIKRLDYLIISHMHSDHYGEVNDIIKNFKISNIITNNNNLEYIDHDISCGNLSFHIYPLEKIYQNENNNSLVLSLYISGNHYLFTGDIEQAAEELFIKKYQFNIDILKVAHHGSSTSSTEEFISKMNPKEAVIIAHRYNKFNHPNQSTIDTLNKYNIIIYQTNSEGTIEFRYFFNKRYIKTYPPS